MGEKKALSLSLSDYFLASCIRHAIAKYRVKKFELLVVNVPQHN